MHIVTIALSMYLGISLFLYTFQSKMVYFPDKVMSYNPGSQGLDYHDVHFDTADNTRIFGWYVPVKEKSRKTILFCHGNAGNIADRLPMVRNFHNMGLNVFIFDYRGFGKSQGFPSEKGTYLDALGAWDYLVKIKKEKPQNIILYGRSLGGAIASYLAKQKSPGALILEATFTSLKDIGQERMPLFPIRWISEFKYDTLSYISDLEMPVLVIHSREDEIIPFSHGQELFRRLGTKKQFLEITGSHNSGYFSSKERYNTGVKEFLSKISALRNTP